MDAGSLLLISGGLDSVALAHWMRPAAALTVDYGQVTFEAELAASQVVCRRLNLRHVVVQAKSEGLGTGLMAGKQNQKSWTMAPTEEWWPYRNQLLVTVAASVALRDGLQSVMIGTVASDRRHRDGTSRFVKAMDNLLKMQEGGIRLVAPALKLSSFELVKRSGAPMSLLAWAHSCHRGNVACGHCPGCRKHLSTRAQMSKIHKNQRSVR